MNSKETIANHATKNEKAAWLRRYKKLERLVKDIEPVEDKMLELIVKRTNNIAEIEAIREELLADCIHPEEALVEHGDYIVCKFCERKMRAVNHGKETNV